MLITDDWWIEHIIPHSLGGSNEMDNLLPSCRFCNFVRSNHSPEYVRRILYLGSAVIREVDRETTLGKAVSDFLSVREAKLSRRRKHSALAMNAESKNTIRDERGE